MKNLPLPNTTVREVTNQLFVEPEKFQKECARQAVSFSQTTGANAVVPFRQGTLLKVSRANNAVSAVAKLNGCEVTSPVVGDAFTLLKEVTMQKNLSARIQEEGVSVLV